MALAPSCCGKLTASLLGAKGLPADERLDLVPGLSSWSLFSRRAGLVSPHSLSRCSRRSASCASNAAILLSTLQSPRSPLLGVETLLASSAGTEALLSSSAGAEALLSSSAGAEALLPLAALCALPGQEPALAHLASATCMSTDHQSHASHEPQPDHQVCKFGIRDLPDGVHPDRVPVDEVMGSSA